MSIHRGVLAALVLSASFFAPQHALAAAPAAQPKLAAGESVLADGLTIAVRRATLSPAAALEVWKVDGLSVHDVVRDEGAAALEAQPRLAAGESVLADGLTIAVRRATLSPTAALEVWIVSPSDGYGASAPGVARLAALSIVATKVDGLSLRDVVRDAGGQLMVSIFPSSTEISVLAPGNAAPQLAQALFSRVLHPSIDDAGLRDARLRLAEQQAVASAEPDVVLRDGLFNQLFSDGPFHASTYGGPDTLRGLSLADAQTFAAKAYVPANEIAVAVGGSLDETALAGTITAAAPAAAQTSAQPSSAHAAPQSAPFNAGFADAGGVGLAWMGPPVGDERTSTAMDFISDYLTRPGYGLVAKAVADADPSADFNGQFITLRDAGIFYVTVSGGKRSADAMSAVIRAAMKPLLDGPMPQADFTRALAAFRTHTLRDTQTPEELADNYGWYFAQGAPAYAPAATDMALSGDYYDQAAALTPQAVYDAAKTYLGAKGVTATVAPRPATPATTSMLDGGAR
ncbi:MAG: insulinase family protein [Candidatus Eremiobacteraeota bacterium]|nr:insulinase family protein [Candidatus Eremiobacteraeota bacterium]